MQFSGPDPDHADFARDEALTATVALDYQRAVGVDVPGAADHVAPAVAPSHRGPVKAGTRQRPPAVAHLTPATGPQRFDDVPERGECFHDQEPPIRHTAQLGFDGRRARRDLGG